MLLMRYHLMADRLQLIQVRYVADALPVNCRSPAVDTGSLCFWWVII
jgi:hypothetical protein